MASTSGQGGNNDRNAKRWIYDVFLSFRGEDTRRNFTDHLYNALVDKRIRTFRDDEKVERGKVIKQEILKAIEESMISIVIFSKNFAFSRWCLEEVVKIIQCRKQLGQTVLPVFYDVDPSHVRNQTESFGEAFAKFEGSKEKMETVQRWRDALSEAGHLRGWDLRHKYESKVIKEISELVLKRLNGTHSNHYKGNEGYEMMRSFDKSYVHKSWSGNVSCQISIPEGQRDIRLNHTCVFKSNPRSHVYGVEENVFSFSTNYAVEDLCVNIEASFTTSCVNQGVCRKGEKGRTVNTLQQGYKGVGRKWIKGRTVNTLQQGYKGVGRKWIKGRIVNPLQLIKGSIGSTWSYLARNQRMPKDKLPDLVLRSVSKDLALRFSSLDVKRFSAKELEKATNNYDESMIIGKGGSAVVYKGILQSNSVVAVKRSRMPVEEHRIIELFVYEVVVLHGMKHTNVVRLLGCCFDTEFPLLVYEYISNGTLGEHILTECNRRPLLSWEMRLLVAVEIARVLSFLHYEASPPMIHRDVKPNNILLDENYTAKLIDFGLAKSAQTSCLVSENIYSNAPGIKKNPDPATDARDKTLEVDTCIKGTLGYLDPEYIKRDKLSLKSDVYSFGVVLAQLVTGRKAIDMQKPDDEKNLARYFCSCLENNRLFEMVDSCLLDDKNTQQIKKFAHLAHRCLRRKGCKRPTMKKVAQEWSMIMTMGKQSGKIVPHSTNSISPASSSDSLHFSSADSSFDLPPFSFSLSSASSSHSMDFLSPVSSFDSMDFQSQASCSTEDSSFSKTNRVIL